MEGAGASIALHHPNYVVVVKGDNVYVVRNRNKQHFNVYIEDAKFTPLALFQSVGGAILVAKEGEQLVSFQLNIDNLSAGRLRSVPFTDKILSSHRSRSFVVLQLEENQVAVIDPETLTIRERFHGKAQDSLDDAFLNNRGEVIDFASLGEWEKLQAANVCKSQKAKQTG